MGKVRQADIARVAGVSQATVSVVLGGNRAGVRLSERTRLRVLEAAERLGYLPDPVSSRLTSARNDLLGVYAFTPAFPDVADGYYPILAGVEAEAAALGKDLIMFTASSAAPDRIRRTRLADGCLFLGRHVPVDALAGLLHAGFPIVYIGRRTEMGGRIPHVGADYVSASAEVITRLARAGHRRVRYLREPDEAPSSGDRERGVRGAAADAGVSLAVTRTDGTDLAPATIAGWLADGVTALVVEETDTFAVFDAAHRALRAAGISVPGDISLAVLGRPPGGAPGPVVSGFEVPRRALGRAAVRLLASLVEPGTGEPPHRLLPCPPVPGETIATVA
ncbi:DNA-binding transcriptional regulator, LacI/PurR family [Amycolatopsis pretoriensis]|uniref:DNA-binding transcriptional regulator, LacI/PurR family n=1 Tax=Amycolatopsis pretoriensis TaxID=218821 RepID=A0A1H5Q7E8_9PSEU|nr:LacI family DNA-binding transcriptional regulator [Amycolatopsis pretoriensis]SEF21814.1 DNA-binding transcriptional regulator, LacI/PurR family [Amycolatopsis pretoriensis]